MRRLGRAAVFALLVVGCARQAPSVVVVGRADGEPEARWGEAMRAVNELGYATEQTDRRGGEITLIARAEPSARFVVELYQQGWVRVRLRHRAGSSGPVEARLYDEYVELVRQLHGELVDEEDE